MPPKPGAGADGGSHVANRTATLLLAAGFAVGWLARGAPAVESGSGSNRRTPVSVLVPAASNTGWGAARAGRGGHRDRQQLRQQQRTPPLTDADLKVPGMPACEGPAAGGPLVGPMSAFAPPPPLQPVPTTFKQPFSRRCRNITGAPPPAPAATASSLSPLGLETLTTFARANALRLRCDLRELRRWGPFPIPEDYCGAKGGSHFAMHAEGEVSWASFEARPELVEAANNTLLARVAWLPSIRKCGSTSLKRFFEHAMATKQHLAPDPFVSPHPRVWADDEIRRRFFQFTVVRDPLSRFLSGAHQLYVFYRMHWFDDTIKRWGVEFWSRVCFNSTWGSADAPPCLGPTGGTAVDLLEALLDDIDRVGFFDQHILPMTYQLAVSRGADSASGHHVFDLKHVDPLIVAMNDVVYNESEKRHRFVVKATATHEMARFPGKGRNPETPWIILADELLELAEKDCKARRVVQRICTLYAEDYRCLPFDPPRACRGVVGPTAAAAAHS